MDRRLVRSVDAPRQMRLYPIAPTGRKMTERQQPEVAEKSADKNGSAVSGAPDIKWLAATVAGVGHDMSSPLSTIASVVDLLDQEDGDDAKELLVILRR